MAYQVRLWCSDCFDDPYGCFADGDNIITTDDNDQPITTKAQAEAIGFHKTKDCGPWRYEVEEIETDETDLSTTTSPT